MCGRVLHLLQLELHKLFFFHLVIYTFTVLQVHHTRPHIIVIMLQWTVLLIATEPHLWLVYYADTVISMDRRDEV